MKIVFWLLLIALLIWGWQNPEKVRSTSDTVMKWTGEKSRWIADEWAPLPPPPPPADPETAVPSLPELPEGVFILRQDVMIATGKTTVKWLAGTSIRKLGEGAGKVLVSDGVNQTTLDTALLTRDPEERKALYRKVEAAKASQTRMAAQALESELAQVESKIASLQAEKRQLVTTRTLNGQPTFGTPEEFLDLAIKRQEERRNEIFKLLGRSAPRMVIAK
jgi:hypothetical protein